MPASPFQGVPFIALRLPKTGGRGYAPGDKFTQPDDVTPRRMKQLIDGRYIAPLTKENYATALRMRTDGKTIGAGFTHDGLVALGIIGQDMPENPEAPVAETLPEGCTEHRGAMLQVFEKGLSKRYNVFTKEGVKLNPKATLNGMKQVDGLLDTIFGEGADAPAVEAKDEETATENLADLSDEDLLQRIEGYEAMVAAGTADEADTTDLAALQVELDTRTTKEA